MNFYISYFYNVRFFNESIIPISTAVWDPKWFHNFKDKSHIFIDKNGVINGIRFEELNPEKCHADGCPCELLKNIEEPNCKFLTEYRDGLNEVDFDKLMKKIDYLINKLGKSKENTNIVFLVYETPDNPCSERKALMDYFKSHGLEISEWRNS
jgi:hypothetical protein